MTLFLPSFTYPSNRTPPKAPLYYKRDSQTLLDVISQVLSSVSFILLVKLIHQSDIPRVNAKITLLSSFKPPTSPPLGFTKLMSCLINHQSMISELFTDLPITRDRIVSAALSVVPRTRDATPVRRKCMICVAWTFLHPIT